jgi:hypothetical protein
LDVPLHGAVSALRESSVYPVLLRRIWFVGGAAEERASKPNAVHAASMLFTQRHLPPKEIRLSGAFPGIRRTRLVAACPKPLLLNLLQFHGSIRCGHVDERSACANTEVLIAGAGVSRQVERKFGA